jgi:hypothetical protein
MPGVSPSTLPTDPTRRGSRSGASGAPRLRQRCHAANPPVMPPHFTSESASEAALEIALGVMSSPGWPPVTVFPFSGYVDASVSPLETLSYRCRPPLGPLGRRGAGLASPHHQTVRRLSRRHGERAGLYQAGTRRHRRPGRLLQIAKQILAKLRETTDPMPYPRITGVMTAV